MTNKYDHVREAAGGPPGDHHCHWPGCEKLVAPALWGCSGHWGLLPKIMRDEIWHSYRAGQEITKTPSRQYLDAADRVQAWIKENYPKARVDKQGKLF